MDVQPEEKATAVVVEARKEHDTLYYVEKMGELELDTFSERYPSDMNFHFGKKTIAKMKAAKTFVVQKDPKGKLVQIGLEIDADLLIREKDPEKLVTEITLAQFDVSKVNKFWETTRLMEKEIYSESFDFDMKVWTLTGEEKEKRIRELTAGKVMKRIQSALRLKAIKDIYGDKVPEELTKFLMDYEAHLFSLRDKAYKLWEELGLKEKSYRPNVRPRDDVEDESSERKRNPADASTTASARASTSGNPQWRNVHRSEARPFHIFL